jgi:hypothetical protein
MTELKIVVGPKGDDALKELMDWTRRTPLRGDDGEQLTRVHRLAYASTEPQTPLRAPHYTVSARAMLGSVFGGRIIPGELSLAHGGALFLDGLEDFRRTVIEQIAVALCCGHIRLLRSGRWHALPARPRRVVARLGPAEQWSNPARVWMACSVLRRACGQRAVA